MTTETKQKNTETKIPEGWVETTLGDSVDILDGDRGGNYPNGDDFSSSGYCCFLNTKNVPGRDFDFSATSFISKEKDELLRKGKLNRGDFVLTTRGTIGNFAFYGEKIPYDNMRINSGMVIFRTKEISDSFFKFYLGGSLFNHQVLSLQSGSAQPQLPIRDLKTFKIYLPPLPEQKAIADVLSSLDDKIELLREQNITLEKTAQTIFKEWFGKYKVGDELPEGWRVGKIMEIIERFPVSYKCVSSDIDDKGTVPILDQGKDGLYGYTKRKPDFEASETDPVVVFTNHTCNYWFIDYPFCAIQNVLPYKGKDGYSSHFIYFMTKDTIKFIEYKGHWPNLAAKDFIIPAVKDTNTFSLFAQKNLSKISANNQQIKTLSKTRDTLLPKLMKGDVRVRTD